MYWYQKYHGKDEEKYCQKIADQIKNEGMKKPIWVYLFAPDPSVAFGGDQYGPNAQYLLYEYDEHEYRAVVEFLKWHEIPVQIRERNPQQITPIAYSTSSATTPLASHSTKNRKRVCATHLKTTRPPSPGTNR